MSQVQVLVGEILFFIFSLNLLHLRPHWNFY